jgi:hypothetical protein
VGRLGTFPLAVRRVAASLVTSRLTASEFEVTFLRLYKDDATSWPPEVFEVLDSLFYHVDGFCPDDAVREQVGGLNERQLLEKASVAFDRLHALPN